jgi:hypothetical protein
MNATLPGAAHFWRLALLLFFIIINKLRINPQ